MKLKELINALIKLRVEGHDDLEVMRDDYESGFEEVGKVSIVTGESYSGKSDKIILLHNS